MTAMFRFKSASKKVRIDLGTIRETIAYIHDDVAADPALSDVATALEKAISAIDAKAVSNEGPGPVFTPVDARFFASRS